MSIEKQLQEIITSITGNFGIYIKDIPKNKVLVDINSSETFPSASVAKIFVAGYIEELLNKKLLNLNDKITHKQEDTLQGGGMLKYMEAGKEYTVLELLKLMLIESDNTASKMLINKIGVKNINTYLRGFDFIKITELKVEDDKFVGWGVTTPLEADKFLQILIDNELPPAYAGGFKFGTYEGIIKNIIQEPDVTRNIGYYLQQPYEHNKITIYSKSGTLYPKVKNTVSLIENKESNQRISVSYFSKDLQNVTDSVEVIKQISKEINILLK